MNISDTILKELKGVLPAGVKLRSHSDDMDKSSNPVSPLKLSPRGHDNEEPRGAKLESEDSDKDEASGSDEVCAKAISSIRPIKAFKKCYCYLAILLVIGGNVGTAWRKHHKIASDGSAEWPFAAIIL